MITIPLQLSNELARRVMLLQDRRDRYDMRHTRGLIKQQKSGPLMLTVSFSLESDFMAKSGMFMLTVQCAIESDLE